ncbi:MAG: endonuclease/exonuclease/phosphatase family metal-dependent hydrolase [Candidatus Latescibacterota bacterium]|jgi:endonuclease/exonuclease/phosphatase family metal-dependent hydrolase
MRRGLFCLLVLLVGCSPPPSRIKVATYNIFWLDDGISDVRRDRLQQVIRELDADFIGFQEIQSRAALENILPDDYEIGILDDKEELQELAIAVRRPFEIVTLKMVFPEEVNEQTFPGKRDLLEAQVEGYGQLFTVLIHHAKSRSGGRVETEERRVLASRMMMQFLVSRVKQDRIILMGDFNDNPDDRSLNILEYGSVDVEGGIDEKPDTYLFNVTESLLDKDYCSYGYNYLYDGLKESTFDPVVKGAREENNKWRGQEHDFMKDVKVKANLFDQILVSQNLKDRVMDRGIFTGASAVVGKRSRVRFEGNKLEYTLRGDFASDHVPVWMVLQF